jgi:hypothetical protein
MTSLVMALYAEGRTDEGFLPVVIQRTAEQVLARRGNTVVDVLEPIVLNHTIDLQFRARDERILEAARRASGFHALIVHADADYPTSVRALQERFLPGQALVDQARVARESVCDHLVPIIPIQTTEAWMLADHAALCEVIGANLTAEALGIPAHPHQVESDPDPKRTLNTVIQRALAQRPRRRRRIDLRSVYEPLARQINLVRLSSVPAYTQFMADLTQTLIALHLVV